MVCNRCESDEGARMEDRFQSEAIITHLYQSCARSMTDDPDIIEVNLSPGP